MLESILGSAAGAISLLNLLLCAGVSIVLGMGVSAVYMFRNTYSKSFVVTLALMPVMVQTVIMLVNGNLGAGVAVMGAFSLVRFRSVPGSAREIGSIFLAMALGLATGMGYLVFALLLLVLVGCVSLALTVSRFGEPAQTEKELKITIPESLDYAGIFDDLFAKYTKRAELISVKTTNMGSLYELCYRVVLRSPAIEKGFLDAVRCRNGNLSIVCGRAAASHEAL